MSALREQEVTSSSFIHKLLNHDLLSPEGEFAITRFIHPGRSGNPRYVKVCNRGKGARSRATRKISARGRNSDSALQITCPASREKISDVIHATVDIAAVNGVTVRPGNIDIRVFPLGNREPVAILPLRYGRRWGWYVRWNTAKTRNGNYRLEAHITENLALRATYFLMAHNYRLVFSIARTYLWSGCPIEDLFNAGVIGLQTAVEKFDRSRKFKFNTYAVWWIRQAIRQGIRTTGRMIRIPGHQWDYHSRIQNAYRTLGDNAALEEVAAYVSEKTKTSFSSENVGETRSHFARQVCSLECSGDSQDARPLLNILSNDSPGQFDITKRAERSAKLREALKILDPREHGIISLRFGLEDDNDHTLEEIGQQYGISRERVRQIEKRIFRKLTQALERQGV